MNKPNLEEKDFLNPNEAIDLFGLSRRKFYKLLQKNKKLDFLAMYGTRRLIVKDDFERYLKTHSELRRRDNYGGKIRNET